MTPAQKVRFLAERCMGWNVFKSGRGSWWARENANTFDEKDRMLEPLHPWDEQAIWNPPTSIADAFECQAKLPIGKYAAFVSALRAECGISYPISAFGQSDLFLIANATAEQRSNAIIKALGGNPDE